MGVFGAVDQWRAYPSELSIRSVMRSALMRSMASKSRRFALDAARHGAATAPASYEALLAAPAVDAIYLPLPTALHAARAERCPAAGKPALVENPFATTAAAFWFCSPAMTISGELNL